VRRLGLDLKTTAGESLRFENDCGAYEIANANGLYSLFFVPIVVVVVAATYSLLGSLGQSKASGQRTSHVGLFSAQVLRRVRKTGEEKALKCSSGLRDDLVT
jgi:hypothetical protein